MSWWKKLFRRQWPKYFYVSVRDGDCQMLGWTRIRAYSYDDLMIQGSDFCHEIMCRADNEKLDEVYWRYEEA